MFLYFKDHGKIININEISRIDLDINEQLVAEFEEIDIQKKEDDLIFTLKDGSKFKIRCNMDYIWKELEKNVKFIK